MRASDEIKHYKKCMDAFLSRVEKQISVFNKKKEEEEEIRNYQESLRNVVTVFIQELFKNCRDSGVEIRLTIGKSDPDKVRWLRFNSPMLKGVVEILRRDEEGKGAHKHLDLGDPLDVRNIIDFIKGCPDIAINETKNTNEED